jgi:hypothetical protein
MEDNPCLLRQSKDTKWFPNIDRYYKKTSWVRTFHNPSLSFMQNDRQGFLRTFTPNNAITFSIWTGPDIFYVGSNLLIYLQCNGNSKFHETKPWVIESLRKHCVNLLTEMGLSNGTTVTKGPNGTILIRDPVTNKCIGTKPFQKLDIIKQYAMEESDSIITHIPQGALVQYSEHQTLVTKSAHTATQSVMDIFPVDIDINQYDAL